MFQRKGITWLAGLAVVLCLGACSQNTGTSASYEAPPAPSMPGHWKVVSDFEVPVEQAKAMRSKLGADLSGVRNTVYDIGGKRVQINVIVTPDTENAERLMMKLRSMKAEEALLQKNLIVYEFVGQNDVLPIVAEGRKHLQAM